MSDALILDDVVIALDKPLLRLSATVAPGEVLTVMGPSGSGKSSLLAYIAGHLDTAFSASGDVRVGRRSLVGVPPYQRRVGMLFQDPLLFPYLSVAGNLLFGLTPNITRAERRVLVTRALSSVGLSGYETRDPETLSGGEKARVSLMRTLLSEPAVLLLDEPFSKLDTELRGAVRDLVFRHATDLGLPVVLVTHDPEDARAAGGQVVTIRS